MKMNQDANRGLTRRLYPKWPRVCCGVVVLSVVVGSCPVVPPALAAQRRPPSDAALRLSLMLAARPKVTEIRRKLSRRVAVGENNGLYFRAPECAVKDVVGTKILRFGRSITGVVRVACVWKSTQKRTFQTPEDANVAELTESEPGKLRLTFVYRTGTWTYQKMNKD